MEHELKEVWCFFCKAVKPFRYDRKVLSHICTKCFNTPKTGDTMNIDDKIPKVEQMNANELKEVLSTLQRIITRTPFEQEARVLRGSYGIHLYYLRNCSPSDAEPFTQWMKQYHLSHNI